MLPRVQRIQKAREITSIFKNGRKYTSPLFSVWVFKKTQGPFRGLAICSRKVDKRATRRNLLKRRVRDILRTNIQQRIPLADIIVEIAPKAKEATHDQLQKELLHVLHIS